MSPNFNPDLRPPNVKNRKFAGIKNWIGQSKSMRSQSIVTRKSMKKSLEISSSAAEMSLRSEKSFLSKLGDKINFKIR